MTINEQVYGLVKEARDFCRHNDLDLVDMDVGNDKVVRNGIDIVQNLSNGQDKKVVRIETKAPVNVDFNTLNKGFYNFSIMNSLQYQDVIFYQDYEISDYFFNEMSNEFHDRIINEMENVEIDFDKWFVNTHPIKIEEFEIDRDIIDHFTNFETIYADEDSLIDKIKSIYERYTDLNDVINNPRIYSKLLKENFEGFNDGDVMDGLMTGIVMSSSVFEPEIFNEQVAFWCGLIPFVYNGDDGSYQLVCTGDTGNDSSPRLDSYQALLDNTISTNTMFFKNKDYFEHESLIDIDTIQKMIRKDEKNVIFYALMSVI